MRLMPFDILSNHIKYRFAEKLMVEETENLFGMICKITYSKLVEMELLIQ